jgi:MFS family permease
LSAFFCGYIITQIPGGWLSQRFGAKYIFGIGILMTGVLTIITPFAADLSIWCLVAVRALEGIFEVSKLNNISLVQLGSFVEAMIIESGHLICMPHKFTILLIIKNNLMEYICTTIFDVYFTDWL